MKFSNLIKDTSFVKKSVNFMITFFRALATLSLTKKMKNLRLFLINLSLILARFYHSLRITEKPVFLNLQETRQDISSETVDVDSNTDLGERRRSVRAKRDKVSFLNTFSIPKRQLLLVQVGWLFLFIF